jgi:signal peptidase I
MKPSITLLEPAPIAAVLLSAVLLVAGCVSVPATPPLGTIKRIEVLDTGSMVPTLRGGEKLDVIPVPFEKLRVGYLVVFLPAWNARPVVHRIVGHEGGRFITRGDAILYPDPGYLTADNYVGVVEVDARSALVFQ